MQFQTLGDIARTNYETFPHVLTGLRRKCVGMLYGDSDSGKSTLALNLAVAVASGTAFPPLVEAGEPQTVLHLDYELTAEEIQERRAAAVSTLSEAERELADANLHMAFAADPASEKPPFSLSDKDTYGRVARLIREKHPALVIVDLVTNAFTIEDENHNTFVRDRVMHRLRGLANAGNTAVLFVHHTGKTGDTWLGAQSFGSNSQAIYYIKTDGEKKTRTLKFIKGRGNPGQPNPSSVRITLNPETGKPEAVASSPKRDVRAAPPSIVAQRPDREMEIVRSVLEKAMPEGFSSKEKFVAAIERKKLNGRPISRDSARVMVDRAVIEGVAIPKPGSGRATAYRLASLDDSLSMSA